MNSRKYLKIVLALSICFLSIFVGFYRFNDSTQKIENDLRFSSEIQLSTPIMGAEGISLNTMIGVYVEDDDISTPSGLLEVYFYDASDDSLIGFTMVVSGATASKMWLYLTEETLYEWYVVVDNGNEQTISDIWSFTTKTAEGNIPPSINENFPEDGAVLTSYDDCGLSVDLSDTDDEIVVLSFCNGFDDSILSSNGAFNGFMSITWSGLEEDTTYEWYVIVDDGIDQFISDTWTFTTGIALQNPPDEPYNPYPEDDALDVGINPELSVTVSDLDNDELIVSFYDESDYSLIGKDTVASGEIASISWSGLSKETTYNWYVSVDDGTESTMSDLWSFTTASFILGDVNDDNSINIIDALVIAQYFSGLNPTGFLVPEAADVNQNGAIDIVDALLVAQYDSGLIDEFPS